MDANTLARAALGRDQQRRMVLANILRILDAADRSTRRSQQAIELAVVQIRKLVMGLPDEALLRERAWRQLRPQITPVLERMALSVGRDLVLEAAAMVPEQATWAASYLAHGMAGDAPGAAAARRAATGENNPFAPRTVEAFPGQVFTTADLGRVGSSPELLGALQSRVPPAVLQQVQAMRIQGSTLRQWFGSSVVLQDQATGRFVQGQGVGGVARTATGEARYAQFAFKSIDRHVRAGFLAGNTTEQIAQNLIADEIRGSMRLGQSAAALKNNARAIARTGLAHLSEQVHQAEWERIGKSALPLAGWRWDASNDSRTCPACSAIDGKQTKERGQLPSIPYHVACRCQCLPVTQTQAAMEASGDDVAGGIRTGVVLTNEKPPAQGPKEPRAAYNNRLHAEGWAISKRKGPSGESYHWRRMEWKGTDGTTADFLGHVARDGSIDATSRALTLQEYFGTGAAGAKRASVFTRLVKTGEDPHAALMGLMRQGSGGMRVFVKADDLAKKWPEWAEAIDSVKPIRSVRQQKALAAGRPMARRPRPPRP